MTARATRREMFGASAAALLLGAGCAGAAKAKELDGTLLELTAELDAQQVLIDANCALSTAANRRGDHAACRELDVELSGLMDDFWAISRDVTDIPARTPEGIQAKARAARIAWRSFEMNEHDNVGRHIAGLVRDLLGEA